MPHIEPVVPARPTRYQAAGSETIHEVFAPAPEARPACYRTDKRLSCGRLRCPWRAECCRLLATWRR
jgi:hypothetical protein